MRAPSNSAVTADIAAQEIGSRLLAGRVILEPEISLAVGENIPLARAI